MQIQNLVTSWHRWQYFFLLLFITNVMMFPHFHQTEYIVVSERMEVNRYNKDYTTAKIRNFKFNRTHTGVNMTFNFNHGFQYDLKGTIQAYRFASNEYRLFPLTFNASICDTLQNDDFGLNNIYNCGNAPHCPFSKGNYTICNWGPDYEKFPPHFPVGRYRIDLKFVFMEKEITDISWYMEVKSTKFLYFN